MLLKGALEDISSVYVLDALNSVEQNSHYCLNLVLDGALADKRPELIATLKSHAIGTSVYYPQPVPRMTYYRKKYGYEPERFVQAAKISDQSIALPVGPHLDRTDVEYLVETVRSSIEGLSI